MDVIITYNRMSVIISKNIRRIKYGYSRRF